jgi:XRE family transcriptional regulator, regulator of sulfur utilization
MVTTGRHAFLSAAVAALAMISVGAQQPAAPAAKAPDTTLMKSAMFTWEAFKVEETKTGARRGVVRAPTATLDEFESHITTLNAGQASHAPHTHPNEEIIILKEGTCEAYINGVWTPMSVGSMAFFASNVPHAIRNVGKTPATYHVVNWTSPGMLKKPAAQ